MTFYEEIEEGPFCERQVFFNSKLHQIAFIERADKQYIPPYSYFDSKEFKACILPGNEWYFEPLLEIAIFRRADGSHYFQYSVTSSSGLSTSTERWIRDTVRSTLACYKEERAGGRDVFLPEDIDEEFIQKQREKLEKRHIIQALAPILNQRYKALMAEIRNDMREGAKASYLSIKYDVDEATVNSSLFSDEFHRPELSRIALAALFNQLSREKVGDILGPDIMNKLKVPKFQSLSIAELLGLDEPENLIEWVHRDPGDVLRGRKPLDGVIFSKKPRLFRDEPKPE